MKHESQMYVVNGVTNSTGVAPSALDASSKIAMAVRIRFRMATTTISSKNEMTETTFKPQFWTQQRRKNDN